MDISHGTVHRPCWNLQGGYHLGAIYKSRGSNEDPAVSCILQEDGGVSNLQFHADLEKEVCLTQRLDETGFGLHEMRVFLTLGEDSDLNQVPPYFLGKISEVGNRSTDLKGFGIPLCKGTGGEK